MIAVATSKPTITDFSELMDETDAFLNEDAARRGSYYAQRGGKLLEMDVCNALNACSKNTIFEGTIKLVSGASFPDIVANRHFGVEVKSTAGSHWTSIGSSILESTRIPDIDRIYLTFGKLAAPVAFMSKPYEECMSDIAVTHYPRYRIDMNLAPDETIFAKMNVSYDKLRTMDNPVEPVSEYYRSKLKPGESLWWAGNDPEAYCAPPILRLWNSLSGSEQDEYTAQCFALFPEILNSSSPDKYQRAALWLVAPNSIVNTCIRDTFSAGGQVKRPILGGGTAMVPAAFGRAIDRSEQVKSKIFDADEASLREWWGCDIDADRIGQWLNLVCVNAGASVREAMSIAYG